MNADYAIGCLKALNAVRGRVYDDTDAEAIKTAIKALEAMPEYEKLKERDRAKKPDLEGDGYDPEGNMVYDTWICPNCERRYEADYDDYDFCPKCGQRIGWLEQEEEDEN